MATEVAVAILREFQDHGGMVHWKWNSKVQRSNAIRVTAKQTFDDTSRSGPGRTIIGD